MDFASTPELALAKFESDQITAAASCQCLRSKAKQVSLAWQADQAGVRWQYLGRSVLTLDSFSLLRPLRLFYAFKMLISINSKVND